MVSLQISSGRLQVVVAWVCRAYLHSVANKKRMTSVVEKIGFSAAQATILNVLGMYAIITYVKLRIRVVGIYLSLIHI